MFTLHIDTSRTWRGGQNQVLLTVLGLRKRGHRTALVMRSDSELAQRSPDHADNFLIDSKMGSVCRGIFKALAQTGAAVISSFPN